jgi:excisionase family DNA binding protein
MPTSMVREDGKQEELATYTYLTLQETCQYLRTSRSTLERMMSEGLIHGYRLYRQNIRFIREELDEYIREHPIEEPLPRRPRQRNRNRHAQSE